MGALPPLRSPFLESNTARIRSEWSEIQRACGSDGGPDRKWTARSGGPVEVHLASPVEVLMWTAVHEKVATVSHLRILKNL